MLPYDTARCVNPDGCVMASQCRRTERGRDVMQPYSRFPQGRDCEGFIRKKALDVGEPTPVLWGPNR